MDVKTCDSWSNEEEAKLLSGIIEHGYGNWEKIQRQLPNKDVLDLEEHYIDRFIRNPKEPELKRIVEHQLNGAGLCKNNCKLLIDYDPENFTNNHSLAFMLDRAREIDCLDEHFDRKYNPWKCTYTSRDSVGNLALLKRENILGVSHSLLNGYNPNRSEFDTEFDDKAESIFSILNENDDDSDFENDEDEDVHRELKVALISSYNLRLSERFRRKKIIRKHALLDRGKNFSVIQRYENVCGRIQLLALLSCMRFLNGPEMDFLLEQLRFQRDLKVRINRLSGYRRFGIKYFDAIPLYEKLYRKRMKHKHELEMNASSISLGIKYHKRASAPLDIHNLPCYSDLEDEEKELCAVSRIVPETYLSFKNLMIQECQKLDGLKLQQARQLFKIDVNKTRKIFDHLMTKKLIWLPNIK